MRAGMHRNFFWGEMEPAESRRKHRVSSYRDEAWPRGVYGISMEGLSLLGIRERDNKLYWDGEEVVTKSVVRLRWVELSFAILAAVGTFGVFALEVGQLAGWWSQIR